MDLQELRKLNHDIPNPDKLVAGSKILLPAGKLSARDKDIIAGIGPRTYRTYPIRKGERLADILGPRGITRCAWGWRAASSSNALLQTRLFFNNQLNLLLSSCRGLCQSAKIGMQG